MIKENKYSSGWYIILAIVAYSLISLVMTYPMIFKLNYFPCTGQERIPPGSDIFIYLWDIWWFKHAVTHLINPFWTDYIFYPQGVSLLFTLANIIWSILAIPLQTWLTLISIYNICFILSLIISGVGAFCLIRYLTGSLWPGFIGGAIYAFAPFHFVHIGHMTVFSVQWLPFFVLFFIKIFEKQKLSNSIYSAIFWALACYSDLNYAVFLGLFVLLFIIYKIISAKHEIIEFKYLKRLGVMIVTLLLLVGPYAASILISAFDGKRQISNPIHSSVSQSSDLLAFFIPSFMHPVFGKLVKPLYDRITTFDGQVLGGYIEVTAYAGFTAIILVIFALIFYRRKLRFWLVAASLFFILSLGPVLKAGGLVKLPAEWLHLNIIAHKIEPNIDPLALEMMKKYIGIPLPYLIWHFTPILSGSESAGRLNIMFVLAWSVLCGFGVKGITEYLRKTNLALIYHRIIYCVIILFILFEFTSFPIRMLEVPVSKFYKTISLSQEDFALLVLPIVNNGLESDPHTRVNRMLFYGFNNTSSKISMYYQTIHHKRIVNGMVCRLFKNQDDFINNSELLRMLAYPRLISKNLADIDISFLSNNKIKYLILQKPYLRGDEIEKLNLFLGGSFPSVFKDNEIIVYQVYK